MVDRAVCTCTCTTPCMTIVCVCVCVSENMCRTDKMRRTFVCLLIRGRDETREKRKRSDRARKASNIIYDKHRPRSSHIDEEHYLFMRTEPYSGGWPS